MTTTKTPRIPRDVANLVGLTEIAERMGVTRYAVDKWRVRGRLPEPVAVISNTPVWHFADIVKWAKETGRMDGQWDGSYEGKYQLAKYLAKQGNGK